MSCSFQIIIINMDSLEVTIEMEVNSEARLHFILEVHDHVRVHDIN